MVLFHVAAKRWISRYNQCYTKSKFRSRSVYAQNNITFMFTAAESKSVWTENKIRAVSTIDKISCGQLQSRVIVLCALQVAAVVELRCSVTPSMHSHCCRSLVTRSASCRCAAHSTRMCCRLREHACGALHQSALRVRLRPVFPLPQTAQFHLAV